MKYLIVKCIPLDDQYECDADRIPLCVTEDYSTYKNVFGYEVWKIQKNGNLKKIQNYDNRG